MKVAVAHHPIIQKEPNELLSKGVIEPEHLHQRSTSSVGRNGQVGVHERVYQRMPYLPLI